MKIKFNEVTWYSRLLSIIFFVGVLPIWTFYIGMQFQKATASVVIEYRYIEGSWATSTSAAVIRNSLVY